ncbi:replicative DNA helicase [Cellulomonas gelida]|uniref:Replicative DNA helicase n=1 Tax=Cellulomonas gelida TaxID=1712 RepID=A0A4Y3KMQ4_9CELL|nr:replicative DNA helicase [Cellulomonas gelida]GEA84664.1 replicative DNA helicase [Cellulomonas gelida]GGL20459.1 replicative DNA helicase [Cellulomonas gelida]
MTIEELEYGMPSDAGSGRREFDRTPPQDLEAERSVLGGMMISKDAIADVIEQIRGTDFYRPAHEVVYDAIIDLYGRGEPADAITVADELTKRGEIGRIGGAPYLHTLIASVPTAANAGYYARIVRERAILRKLVEAGTRIVQLGYGTDGGDVDELVNNAQAEVYAVTERRSSEDYLPLSEIIGGTVDEIEAAGHRGEGMIGVPTGFSDLDRLTNGLHPGQMIVVAARPAIGKSTLGIDVVRSAAIKHNMSAVVFSLEMSRNEIVMRLLSAEARVHLQKLRTGQMGEDDWAKIAQTMGKISAAPLFIDDSPNMSLMEIRAKCRRLKQRHDLKLVVIDYLQLMTSGKRVESRQQEVSEFSRALKLLAKELEVPVIAISQLNRGPEQRTDKKPQMSDLRESGCLTEDTRVLRADTGAETTLGELYALRATDVPVWALDDRLQYVRRHLTHVFPTGVKPTYRLRLASGKEVTATANHPFLTYEGWTPLGELEPGSRIGVPRHVPGPEQTATWLDRDVTMLARMIAGRTAPGAAVWDDEVWEQLGESLPASLFHLPKPQIALFLRTLLTQNGAVTLDGGTGLVTLRATGRRVLDGVSRLLLRFGISTRIRRSTDGMVLELVEKDDLRRLLQEVGIEGRHAVTADELLRRVRERDADASTEPVRMWDEVRTVLMAAAARSQAEGRAPLAQVVDVLDRADLQVDAVNDLLWDEVVAIEPMGDQQVFDATVVGTHNFIANGIAVHNSIEQDADMVILLHREDAYEKESPRAGEADLIVAKHRNGPTDTITVAFQGHFSRFVDMQA